GRGGGAGDDAERARLIPCDGEESPSLELDGARVAAGGEPEPARWGEPDGAPVPELDGHDLADAGDDDGWRVEGRVSGLAARAGEVEGEHEHGRGGYGPGHAPGPTVSSAAIGRHRLRASRPPGEELPGRRPGHGPGFQLAPQLGGGFQQTDGPPVLPLVLRVGGAPAAELRELVLRGLAA